MKTLYGEKPIRKQLKNRKPHLSKYDLKITIYDRSWEVRVWTSVWTDFVVNGIVQIVEHQRGESLSAVKNVHPKIDNIGLSSNNLASRGLWRLFVETDSSFDTTKS